MTSAQTLAKKGWPRLRALKSKFNRWEAIARSRVGLVGQEVYS